MFFLYIFALEMKVVFFSNLYIAFQIFFTHFQRYIAEFKVWKLKFKIQ